MKTNTIEQMFDNVSDAYVTAGKKMDAWTLDKFSGLQEAYAKHGKLFDKQIDLLNSLTKYIPKSPSISSGKNEQIKETAVIMEQLVKEKYANADADVLSFCRDFENRVATTPFTPNKDELFDYYFQKRKLNTGFTVPNKWVGEFMQYCVGR
jgi:hypothetical protein